MSQVFLIQANSFSEAQVIKNLLLSHDLHPFFRDENIRTIAPHYEQLLGKIIIEISEDEFVQASQLIEQMQDQDRRNQKINEDVIVDRPIDYAKKSLQMAVIGAIILPILGSFYSTILAFRAFKNVRRLNQQELLHVFASMMINIFSFCFWLLLIHRWLSGR